MTFLLETWPAELPATPGRIAALVPREKIPENNGLSWVGTAGP